MKKLLYVAVISIAVFLISILLFVGCSVGKGIDVNDFTQSTSTESNSNSNSNTNNNSESYIDNTLGSYDTGLLFQPIDFASMGAEYQAFLDVPVDINILDLSDIMAFAQVNNMMMMAEEYLGQTVKLHGNYYRHDIDEMDLSYHFLLLVDGTNCCTGILEFLFEDGMEYPPSGTDLLLMGEYSKYTDDYGTYPYIKVSDYLTY